MQPLIRKTIAILLTLALLLAAASHPALPPPASAAGLPPDLLRAVERLAPEALEVVEQKVNQPGQEGSEYGGSVALGADMALIGSPAEDTRYQEDTGVVYYFTRSGSEWALQQVLYNPGPEAPSRFGSAIGLSGDRAYIGAPGARVGWSTIRPGAVYVYNLVSGMWQYGARLSASDGADGDDFGRSLAYSDNRLLIGAPGDHSDSSNELQGSAYTFVVADSAWSEEDKLTASDGAAGDRFGSSVALLGSEALIGAWSDDVGPNPDQGTAYLFTRVGPDWTEQAHLIASDGSADDRFGFSTALAVGVAVVGAPYDDVGDGSNDGSVYVFTGSGAAWSEAAHLIDSAGAGGWMGYSLALTPSTLVVGSPFANDPALPPGCVMIYTGGGAIWTEQARLFRNSGFFGDQMGYSVAYSNDTVLTGAPFADAGAIGDTGAAYIFAKNGQDWSQQTLLTTSMAQEWDYFGYSAAIDGDVAAVGVMNADVGARTDQGAVLIFTRSGGVWQPQQRLTAADGAGGDHFGQSVALSGDTLLVGATGVYLEGEDHLGAVYVFERNAGGVWEQQAKMVAAGGEQDLFGYAVALDGDTAAVGAPDTSIGPADAPGTVYVFTRSGAEWSLQAQLYPAQSVVDDRFGFSLALSGETLAVGAYYAPNAADRRGAVYVFTRSGALWTQQARLAAADAVLEGWLGFSVALEGNTLLAGAPFTTLDGQVNRGAAYVFTRRGATWSQAQRLTVAGGQSNDLFGFSVALDGDTALVASVPDLIDDTRLGATYVYGRAGALWLSLGKLAASDGRPKDLYGIAATLSGSTALIGAPGFLDIHKKGSAYFYEMDAQAYAVLLPLLTVP